MVDIIDRGVNHTRNMFLVQNNDDDDVMAGPVHVNTCTTMVTHPHDIMMTAHPGGNTTVLVNEALPCQSEDRPRRPRILSPCSRLRDG